MSFGISLFQLYEYVSKKKLGIIWVAVLSLLELYAVYRLFALMLYQPVGVDNYRRIVYIIIIVFLSFLNVTALSRLLNNRISRRLGSISLAMYLSHFCMISVYFRMVSAIKAKLNVLSIKSALAKSLSKFLRDAGGGGYGAAKMTWKDILIYVLMLAIVSVLILLAIAGVKKFIVRPLLRARDARLAAADADSADPA